MVAFLPPVSPGKPKWWFPYFLLAVIILFLFWKLAPGRFMNFLDRLSLFHVTTPQISGTVVDAFTGRPVPGMDVCLLVTRFATNFDHGHETKVMRSAMTQTDTSGTFSFARWDDQLDLLDKWDGYGIAIIDPAARWKDMCGQDIYLLGTRAPSGHTDVFERERYFQSLSDSAAKNTAPYFPVAMVKDPIDPHPEPYGPSVSFGSFTEFPHATFVRRIGDPSKLKIALVPLLRDEKECRLVQDSDLADLCRQMNHSLTADRLRTSWKISPQENELRKQPPAPKVRDHND
jgi:hypothetical protein